MTLLRKNFELSVCTMNDDTGVFYRDTVLSSAVTAFAFEDDPLLGVADLDDDEGPVRNILPVAVEREQTGEDDEDEDEDEEETGEYEMEDDDEDETDDHPYQTSGILTLKIEMSDIVAQRVSLLKALDSTFEIVLGQKDAEGKVGIYHVFRVDWVLTRQGIYGSALDEDPVCMELELHCEDAHTWIPASASSIKIVDRAEDPVDKI